jgi:serine/threonine protein kinase
MNEAIHTTTARLDSFDDSASDKASVFLRAKELIDRAYQQPEEQRDQLINAECAEDVALRDEVKWMLEGLRAPEDDFLEQPGVGRLADMMSELKVPAPRRYTLLRPLGQGGSGMVYLAERIENRAPRVVAVKLLNPQALRNQSAVTHFLRERELLAQLAHPGIARLIDAGALEDGQPFLAMEYVEGKAIDRYCDDNSLSLTARLQLFVKVCEAVQYAHQQLIIHRDIKPDNVLVTERGEPKLVDFGIARTLATDAEVTATAYRRMSLAYASPEQIAGHALSTGTDLYSLGILLYELVTGSTPWGGGDYSVMLATRINTIEPEPASKAYKRHAGNTGTSADGFGAWKMWVAHKLPADLDAILFKALRHRSQDRYATVQALADDVDRLLRHYPVDARRGQHAYRWRMFVRRNWPWLSGVGGILILSIGFGIDRSIQLERTRTEEAKVRAEVAKVKEISNFLSELFTQPMPEFTQGREVTARALLDHGASRLRQLFDGDPATKITLLNTLARTYISLGDLNNAPDLAAHAVQLAHDSPNVSKQLLMEALLNAAAIEQLLPRGVLMEKYMDEAVALAQSDKSIKSRDFAMARQWLAYSHFLLGYPIENVEREYRKSMSILQAIAPESNEMANVEFNLILAQAYFGKSEEAWIAQQSAEKLMEHTHGEHHPATLRSKTVSGLLLADMGDAARAEQLLQATLSEESNLLGKEHILTVIAKRYLVVALMAQGKWKEAEAQSRAYLELTRKLRYYGSFSTFYALLTEADLLQELHGFDEAERLSREAVEVAAQAYAPSEVQRWQAAAYIYLAQAKFGNGEIDAAKELLRNALRNLPDIPDTLAYRVRAWKTLGQIGATEHDFAAAEAAYKTAFDLAPTATSYRPFVALEFGRFLIGQGRFDQAQTMLVPLVKRLQDRMPPDAPILENAIATLEHLHAEGSRRNKNSKD